MGILPLEFLPGENLGALGLTGRESFTIRRRRRRPRRRGRGCASTARADDGRPARSTSRCRIDGPIELDYYRNGGILPAVLRRLAREGAPDRDDRPGAVDSAGSGMPRRPRIGDRYSHSTPASCSTITMNSVSRTPSDRAEDTAEDRADRPDAHVDEPERAPRAAPQIRSGCAPCSIAPTLMSRIITAEPARTRTMNSSPRIGRVRHPEGERHEDRRAREDDQPRA